MKVAFIGGGKMAEAILHGVLSGKLATPADISVGEPVPARRDYLTSQFGVNAYADNLKTASGSDLVVLAVKPQDLGGVMGQLKGNLNADQAALSIVAGAKMETLSNGLGHDSVVRVMPNTPAQIGAGMTLWTCSDGVGDGSKELIKSVLGTIGQEIYVSDEKYMDMATALSASGPAYIFLFIEAMIDAGVYVGMPRDMARTLALQTMYGSTKLVMETGMHPAELKDMVVSPGGTTAEAMRVLEDQGVPAAIVSAIDAAYKKSIQLGKG
ncbi:MAG TPA: pyrroline-5-carboxylate reductase [Dehalococcoidia bacterium]|nr:pyrroline-5-carboxylate reductase [SAR202 cluster bacterium]HAA95792.1 pyrroline-5-carboxylate reductase [Dehalococcoidia bacterium]|tara:strand:- start:301 stop:1104 length:804 start_codon:yes stop_codon:yes gene_type:complete